MSLTAITLARRARVTGWRRHEGRAARGHLAFADCSLRVGDREMVRGRAVFAVLSED